MKPCDSPIILDSNAEKTGGGKGKFIEIFIKNEVLENPLEAKSKVLENPIEATHVAESNSHVEEQEIEINDDKTDSGCSPSSPPSPKGSGQTRDQSSKSTRRCKMKISQSQSRKQRSKQGGSCLLPAASEKDNHSENDNSGKEDGKESITGPGTTKKKNVENAKESSIIKGQKGDSEDDDEEKESDKNVSEEWKQLWGIRCSECSQIFPHKKEFDKHYIDSYGKKPIYTCSYCNKRITKYSTFRSHRYRHVNDGRYQCEYCKRGFSMKYVLNFHILARHKKIKQFICEECGKSFSTRTGLTTHLQKHGSDRPTEYPCSECGKILHSKGGLTAHMNLHNPAAHFMCDVCGKTFAQKVNMLQHAKLHTGERPFPCEQCGKCFAQKAHLSRHYVFHSEKRPFQCRVCLKKYKTERCLKVHERVHSDIRPYSCPYCSKGFLSSSDLKQHINIHTGARPFACKYCERTFTNYPNWLKHSRRLHNADPKSGVVPIRPTSTPAFEHYVQWQELQQKVQVTVTPEIPENVEMEGVKSESPDSPPEMEPQQ